jgi:lysophospholipase L1-like esterase
MTRTIRFATAVLGISLAAAACNNDTLNRPYSFTAIDPLFERYVSMGNSLTAGFQSGGINDSTQQQSYAVLLARAMRSPFFVPSLTKPGCPPPFTNVWTGARVTPTGYPPSTATSCYLRNIPSEPPPYISNTAVPGAKVEDLYTNLDTAASPNTLTQFILGGLTQVQMLRRAQPTFVSVWAGNNDILGAATSATNPGDSTKITSLANFQARYTTLLDSINAVGPRGAILIGVANVTEIPFFSAGATYWAIKNGLVPGAAFPPAFTVSNNCAPGAAIPGLGRGDTTLVPFPYGAALIGAAAQGAARNLDCSDSVVAIVTPPELRKLVAADSAYNLFISAQATAHGWAYLTPNGALDSLRTLPQPNTVVRAFPLIGQPCSANPFGTAFSCDGVHASASTHKLIANKLRAAINATYSTSIPVIP